MAEKPLICPKCGTEQPQGQPECCRCGVVFSRLSRKPKTAAPAQAGSTKKPGGFFRGIRVAVLLLIFLGLGLNMYLTRWRIAEWNRPLWVIVHPICADAKAETRRFVDSLTPDEFQPLAQFFAAEADRYGLKTAEPFTFVLAPRLDKIPPQIPPDPTPLAMIAWSLKLRFWAWRITAADTPVQDIKLFVLYHDTGRILVEHSFVMEKGYIGIVHAYAEPKMQETNLIVIAHELLHLAGAQDKYDKASELPLYPDGYADPAAEPLYPQTQAEIMAGSIPVTAGKSVMPDSLDEVVIGQATAKEINWHRPDKL